LALALAHEAKERNATKLAQARLQTLQSGR
jgi:hypothetical protein